MWDNNLLFSSAQVVTATGFSTNALLFAKSKADGIWVELAVSAVSGTTPTLDVTAYTKDVDSAWATTDRTAGLSQAQITAAGRYLFRVQTKNQYVKLRYVVSGTTPSFTITAGVVSGPQQDAMV